MLFRYHVAQYLLAILCCHVQRSLISALKMHTFYVINKQLLFCVYVFAQERHFLRFSNYVFTVIFLLEMTIKVFFLTAYIFCFRLLSIIATEILQTK